MPQLPVSLLDAAPADVSWVTSEDVGRVARSMKSGGQITALKVTQAGDRYLVKDGVARFLAAVRDGVEQLHCEILDPRIPESEHLLRRLMEKKARRQVTQLLTTFELKRIAEQREDEGRTELTSTEIAELLGYESSKSGRRQRLIARDMEWSELRQLQESWTGVPEDLLLKYLRALSSITHTPEDRKELFRAILTTRPNAADVKALAGDVLGARRGRPTNKRRHGRAQLTIARAGNAESAMVYMPDYKHQFRSVDFDRFKAIVGQPADQERIRRIDVILDERGGPLWAIEVVLSSNGNGEHARLIDFAASVMGTDACILLVGTQRRRAFRICRGPAWNRLAAHIPVYFLPLRRLERLSADGTVTLGSLRQNAELVRGTPASSHCRRTSAAPTPAGTL